MPDKTTIIFFGDVVGALGRKAVKEILPQWKQKYQPDLFVANVENLAHGKGLTPKTLNELKDAGVHVFTGGNHMWAKFDLADLDKEGDYAIAAPANDSRTPSSMRYHSININNQEIIFINLTGRTFIEDDNLSNPFHQVDRLLAEMSPDAIKLVDMHAEATSEKKAMGYYLDGKISAMVGTHTHVPTADSEILPGGTGYITDIGMVGPYPSVLGIKTNIIIDKFLKEEHIKHELPDSGQIELNAVLLEIDNNTHKTTKIKLLREIL
jgi:2',3'-cyclic-nucleotide 2'-phosphodiesterase